MSDCSWCESIPIFVFCPLVVTRDEIRWWLGEGLEGPSVYRRPSAQKCFQSRKEAIALRAASGAKSQLKTTPIGTCECVIRLQMLLLFVVWLGHFTYWHLWLFPDPRPQRRWWWGEKAMWNGHQRKWLWEVCEAWLWFKRGSTKIGLVTWLADRWRGRKRSERHS